MLAQKKVPKEKAPHAARQSSARLLSGVSSFPVEKRGIHAAPFGLPDKAPVLGAASGDQFVQIAEAVSKRCAVRTLLFLTNYEISSLEKRKTKKTDQMLNVEWFFHPSAAPSTGGFERICPLGGDAGMRRVLRRGWEALRKPRSNLRSVNSGICNSLDKQRKVPRLSGRDPTSKTNRRDSDTK